MQSFRERLRARERVIGPWCVIPSVQASVAIGEAGMDFAIVDAEHGAFDAGSMTACIHAIRSTGCAALVRPSGQHDRGAAQTALDAGADGLVIPGVASGADAEKIRSWTRYFPEGTRGFSPFTPAGAQARMDSVEHRRRSNRDLAVIGIIESPDAFDDLDAIVEADAFDALYVGAYDLSVALGYEGNVADPKFQKEFAGYVERCIATGLTVGGYVARRPEQVDWLLGMGMTFITCEVDLAALHVTYLSFFDRLQESNNP